MQIVTMYFGEFSFRDCLKILGRLQMGFRESPKGGEVSPFGRLVTQERTLEKPSSYFSNSLSKHSGE